MNRRVPSTQVLAYSRSSLRDCQIHAASLQKTEMRPRHGGSGFQPDRSGGIPAAHFPRRGRTRNTGQGCPVNWQARMPAPQPPPARLPHPFVATSRSYAIDHVSYGFAPHPDVLPDNADVSGSFSYVFPRPSYGFARVSYVLENHSYGVGGVFQHVGTKTRVVGMPWKPVGMTFRYVGEPREPIGEVPRYVGIDCQGARTR